MVLMMRANGKRNTAQEVDRLAALCQKYERLVKLAKSVPKRRAFTNKANKYRVKWGALQKS